MWKKAAAECFGNRALARLTGLDRGQKGLILSTPFPFKQRLYVRNSSTKADDKLIGNKDTNDLASNKSNSETYTNVENRNVVQSTVDQQKTLDELNKSKSSLESLSSVKIPNIIQLDTISSSEEGKITSDSKGEAGTKIVNTPKLESSTSLNKPEIGTVKSTVDLKTDESNNSDSYKFSSMLPPLADGVGIAEQVAKDRERDIVKATEASNKANEKTVKDGTSNPVEKKVIDKSKDSELNSSNDKKDKESKIKISTLSISDTPIDTVTNISSSQTSNSSNNTEKLQDNTFIKSKEDKDKPKIDTNSNEDKKVEEFQKRSIGTSVAHLTAAAAMSAAQALANEDVKKQKTSSSETATEILEKIEDKLNAKSNIKKSVEDNINIIKNKQESSTGTDSNQKTNSLTNVNIKDKQDTGKEGKRVEGVDFGPLLSDLQERGLTLEQSQILVNMIDEAIRESMENISKSMATKRAQLEEYRKAERDFHQLRTEIERLESTDSNSLRVELKKVAELVDRISQSEADEINRVHAGARLDMNLERARAKDELEELRALVKRAEQRIDDDADQILTRMIEIREGTRNSLSRFIIMIFSIFATYKIWQNYFF